MNKLIVEIAILLVALTLSETTRVQLCHYPSNYKATTNLDYTVEQLNEQVQIATCNDAVKNVCQFKKSLTYPVSIAFTPKSTVQTLYTMLTVSSSKQDIPLDYPGWWAQSLCDHVHLPNGDKSGCPLTAGQEYVVKVDLPIKHLGRNMPLELRWALMDKDTVLDQICFHAQVQANT